MKALNLLLNALLASALITACTKEELLMPKEQSPKPDPIFPLEICGVTTATPSNDTRAHAHHHNHKWNAMEVIQ